MRPIEPLEPATVRVRWFSVEAVAAVHLCHWRAMLDDEGRSRADRMRFAADRDTFIAAHAPKRAMLSDATGQAVDRWRFRKGPFGKPALVGGDAEGGLDFNLAHTRGLVACAIARGDVGVDVEVSDRRVDFLSAERHFAPEEVEAI